MNTSFLKELGLEQEVIDKVMAENGKDVEKAKSGQEAAKSDLEKAKQTITDYEQQLKELKESAGNAQELQGKITALENQIREREEADKKAVADKAMDERFTAVIGENKFINDFTKNGVLNEFKVALEDEANAGKADADIYGAIVKDREGLFENPNPLSGTPGANGNVTLPGAATNDQLSKMSYEEYKAFRSGKKE